MLQKAFVVWLCFWGGAAAAADLPTAPAEELMRVYSQLRSLRGSDQWAVTENVVWKRDAATFTLREGHLTFAEPVAGHVVAAVFEGQGSIELKPPTGTEMHQIGRFTRGSGLTDQFHEAVFFFTDDSWAELQKLLMIHSGGDAEKAGQALESAQKKYAESFNDWWENETKGNPTMRNLAARMLADLSDPSSRGLFLADFKGEHSGHLLYQISWNRDSLILPGISNDEEVMLLHYDLNSYFEWWAGFHLTDEYAHGALPEHRTLLAHCREERMEAEIGKDNRLAAAAEMQFEVPHSPVRVLPLNLSGVLRISSIQDAQGRKLSFIQEDRKLASDPWVILAEPASAGRVYSLRIEYEEDSTHDSRVVHQRGSGLYYVTTRESWFPSFGAFDDRSRYLLRFRSPKKFVFVATGHLVKSRKEKEFLETEWESEIPYSVVGFNYGDFVEKSQSDPTLAVTAYSGKEIPDELQGLLSRIDAAEVGLGGTSRAGGETGITGRFSTADMAGVAAGVSYQALKLFEFYFGPLPFKNVSVTEQPIRGYGQSWPTLIFLPYDSLLDAQRRHTLHLDQSAEAREFYDVVAVHEMAHQWWGHLVGWKTYHDQWMSEGFAEFSASLYLRKTDPKKVKDFWDLKRKWLLSKNRKGNRPVDVGPLWLNYQLNGHLEEENSERLIYMKGAYVLEMLRLLMEDPRSQNPDARFVAMMQDFVSRYSAKNPSSEEFRQVVEKHFGQPMDWFFNEWVYGTEIPHYDFNYQLKPGDGGKTILKASITQSAVSDQFLMKVPVYVFIEGQPRRLGLITVKGPTTAKAEVLLPFRPDKVTADEFHSILCTMKQ